LKIQEQLGGYPEISGRKVRAPADMVAPNRSRSQDLESATEIIPFGQNPNKGEMAR